MSLLGNLIDLVRRRWDKSYKVQDPDALISGYARRQLRFFGFLAAFIYLTYAGLFLWATDSFSLFKLPPRIQPPRFLEINQGPVYTCRLPQLNLPDLCGNINSFPSIAQPGNCIISVYKNSTSEHQIIKVWENGAVAICGSKIQDPELEFSLIPEKLIITFVAMSSEYV